MAKHTLKILRCEHRKIFKVCLAIFQHYAIKFKIILKLKFHAEKFQAWKISNEHSA